MGTNFYRIPSAEEVNKKRKVLTVQVENMELNPKDVQGGFNFIRPTKDWEWFNPWDIFMKGMNVHLGKRSSGWKFCWNFHENKYYSNKDELIVTSFRSTIGYLLHAWKNLSYSPAIILNDEVISDNPEGGTGKGLFMNALSHMKKLVVIDGKSFNFEKSFAYQLVSADTQILCFDDVKKYFDFERLFSLVTEGLTLEKKNKDAIKIPFGKSPKVAITTNYAIIGEGSSFERRKWELELSQHYTNGMTPLKDFKRLMFGEWDDDEWCAFDNYMIENVMFYLTKGLIKGNFKNQTVRNLGADTSHEVVEWGGLFVGFLIFLKCNLLIYLRLPY